MTFTREDNGRHTGWLPGFLGIVWLAFALCSTHLSGAAAQTEQSGRPFTMRVDVELVTAEVVVLDKKGKPVHDLKKDSFRLYEDGKQQEIVSFDEVNGESGEEASTGLPDASGNIRRGKTVMLLFDDRTIPYSHIQETRDAAERFVQEHMQPQDLFAVVTNSLSLEILQNFTDDPEKILAAIRRKAVPSSIQSSDKSRLEQSGIGFIRSLDSLSQSVERIRGRKAILLFSQNITLSPGPENQKTYLKMVNSARKANAIFFTVEPQGLEFSSSVDAPISGQMDSNKRTEIFAPPESASTDQQDYLRPLAANTGGFSIFNTSDFDKALDGLDQQLSSYYILGFQSGNPKRDGSYRELEVKTDLKDAALKFRKGYVDRRPLDTLASSKREKSLLDAMASSSAAAQLPLSFRPIYFYDSPGLARVLVSARIRMEKAVFKKKGGQSVCSLNVMGAAYSENDTVAARFSETVQVIEDKKDNLRDGMVYSNYFRLRPGKYRLKLAASDDANNIGAMEQRLEIPAIPESGLAGSSLVIVEGTSPLPALIENLETQMLDDNDPLILGGLQVTPSIENKLPIRTQLPVLFKLYNPAGDLEHWQAVANARLVKDNGESLSLPAGTLEQNLSQSGSAGATFGLNLALQGVTSGKYALIIEITESATSRKTTVQTDLEFTAD
jgi:VWFA-related protein